MIMEIPDAANNLAERQGGLHNTVDFQNLWTCQRIIRDWARHPEWDSYDVLPVIYTALHTGRKNIPGKGSSPKLAEVVRNSTAFLPGSPANLLVPHENVYLLTSKYSRKLDEILRQKPKTLSRAIEDAAFTYYVFDRIHPFPDGNGRVGRMIVKRVLQTAGVKDPLFHDKTWYGSGRSEHKLALEKVDETNTLTPLELFLAQTLVGAYDQSRDFLKHQELSRFIASKEKTRVGITHRSIADIWDGFVGIPIYGSRPEH